MTLDGAGGISFPLKSFYIPIYIHVFLFLLSCIMLYLYIVHLSIEDLSRRLRADDLGIPPDPGDRYTNVTIWIQ